MSDRTLLVMHHLELSLRSLNHDDVAEAIRELVQAVAVSLREDGEQIRLDRI